MEQENIHQLGSPEKQHHIEIPIQKQSSASPNLVTDINYMHTEISHTKDPHNKESEAQS